MSPSRPPPPPPRCPSSSPWPPWPPTPLWRPFNLPGRQEAPTGLPRACCQPPPWSVSPAASSVCSAPPPWARTPFHPRPGLTAASWTFPTPLLQKGDGREREGIAFVPRVGVVRGPFPTPPSLSLLLPLLALVCVGAVLWPSPILFSPCCSVGLSWSVPPPPPPPLVQPSLVYEGKEEGLFLFLFLPSVLAALPLAPVGLALAIIILVSKHLFPASQDALPPVRGHASRKETNQRPSKRTLHSFAGGRLCRTTIKWSDLVIFLLLAPGILLVQDASGAQGPLAAGGRRTALQTGVRRRRG